MQKLKRILALLGAIVLVGLYVSTIVCALSSDENFMNLLMASVYATVVIPALLWAYGFLYRLTRGGKGEGKETKGEVKDETTAD